MLSMEYRMNKMKIWHFIGPKDNYDGLYGVEYNNNSNGWTFHIFPRVPFWGTEKYEDEDTELITHGVGPFFSLTMAKYKA